MTWSVRLTPCGDRERFTASRDGGPEHTYDLHDYAAVYAEPGLYDEVVQEILGCRSPAEMADLLGSVTAGGVPEAGLRILDVGAGNGVSGQELRRLQPSRLVGHDNIDAAREAARRDRPGVYDAYHVTPRCDADEVVDAVAAERLNTLVAVGATSNGHVLADDLLALWSAFPPGSWLGLTVFAEDVNDAAHDVRRALARSGPATTHVRERHTFRHRFDMHGTPIMYEALVAQKS